MRLWLTAIVIALVWVLAVAYYVESGGIDCYPACSTAQDMSGIVAFGVLPLVFLLVVIAALVGSVRSWSRRRRERRD